MTRKEEEEEEESLATAETAEAENTDADKEPKQGTVNEEVLEKYLIRSFL